MINTDKTYTHYNRILYVSQLKKNLLSIGCASEKGIRVIFEDDRQSIFLQITIN